MNKLIKKVKVYLIHKLGGFTLNECNLRQMDARRWETIDLCQRLLKKADSMYGQSADDWCNGMYTEIDYIYKYTLNRL